MARANLLVQHGRSYKLEGAMTSTSDPPNICLSSVSLPLFQVSLFLSYACVYPDTYVCTLYVPKYMHNIHSMHTTNVVCAASHSYHPPLPQIYQRAAVFPGASLSMSLTKGINVDDINNVRLTSNINFLSKVMKKNNIIRCRIT